jgi:hypothetical protein
MSSAANGLHKEGLNPMKSTRKMQRIVEMMITRSIKLDSLRPMSASEKNPPKDTGSPDSGGSK